MLAEGLYGAITTSPQREVVAVFVRMKSAEREVARTILLATSAAGGSIHEQLDRYLSAVYVDYEHKKVSADRAMEEELKLVEKAGYSFSVFEGLDMPNSQILQGQTIEEVL